jgi:osmotically inducible protein OsmC
VEPHHGVTQGLSGSLPHLEGPEENLWIAASIFRQFRITESQNAQFKQADVSLERINNMSIIVKYTTKAVATSGRDGRSKTEDGSLDVRLSIPKEMGGDGSAGTNPEQLFAAGYAACFLSALKFQAVQANVKVPADSTVAATIGIGPRSEGGFGLTAKLEVLLPGVNKEEAQSLVEKAHQVCPYSNATRNNVEVEIQVL